MFEYMSLKRVDLAVGSTSGGNGLTSNPHLWYATLAIVIGIGFVAVFWIHRKGYQIKILRKPK
jgi:hypothetical protein